MKWENALTPSVTGTGIDGMRSPAIDRMHVDFPVQLPLRRLRGRTEKQLPIPAMVGNWALRVASLRPK